MAVGRHSDADRYFGLKKVRRPMEQFAEKI